MTKGQTVYVASHDRCQKGFNGTIVSIGRKYITVENKYGRKYHFDVESHYCEEWSIYELYENEETYKKETERKEKARFISINVHKLIKVLSDQEIDDIYNRIMGSQLKKN